MLNDMYFEGALKPVPIRITRSVRTYGYFNAPNGGGQPSIRISVKLAKREGPDVLRDTMLHEMIHQSLHSTAHPLWDTHGEAFQFHHNRIFGTLYEEPT